jgi:hypothetical protein
MLILSNMFWLIGLIAVSSGSLLVIINTLRKAPEAFEDEHGFHILPARHSGAGVLRKPSIEARQRRKTEAAHWRPISHSP